MLGAMKLINTPHLYFNELEEGDGYIAYPTVSLGYKSPFVTQTEEIIQTSI